LKKRRPYQDKWRDGQLVQRGRRDCGLRYEKISGALRSALGEGPWSVADIGGWDGYFTRRLVEDFGGPGTLVEPRKTDLSGTGIAHRQMKVTASTVSEVGFHDAILVLSVFHHMTDWLPVYQGLKAQCRILIIELALPDEVNVMKAVIQGAEQNTEPSHAHIMREAKVFGSTRGPNKVVRPLLIMQCATQGVVETGGGHAARLVTEGDFSRLGYKPYPGTLNLRVGRHNKLWFQQQPGVQIPSGRSRDQYIPARIDGLDLDVHVSFSRGREVIEILAPCRLREWLADGDRITIRPAGEPGSLPSVQQ